MPLYALNIFFSALLLFLVQPLLGKYLIPLYGGGPTVWAICLLFFQTILIFGYAYAHLVTSLRRDRQGYVHVALLLFSLLFLPRNFSAHSHAIDINAPVASILGLLVLSVGMPFLLLSSTSPLLQHWFIRDHRGRSPWKLYALSNIGSFSALLLYPFVFEPLFSIDQQRLAWLWGYCIFVVLCGLCALVPLWFIRSHCVDSDLEPPQSQALPLEERRVRLDGRIVAAWLACSAGGSATLLAVTNQICQQVTVAPLLWILPLIAYLGTFVFCFSFRNIYTQNLRIIYLVIPVITGGFALTAGNSFSLPIQLVLFLVTLITCCMTFHGELVRFRPETSSLTHYYLMIAIGGAAGTFSISILAPLLFSSYVELPLLVATSCAIFVVGAYLARNQETTPRWHSRFGIVILVVQLAFSAFYIKVLDNGVIENSRNFFGTLKVISEADSLGTKLTLKHGIITHGSQYKSPGLSNYAAAYYGPETGAGLALRFHPHRLANDPDQRSLRVGLVGIGTGALSVYGQRGDTFRFYEIDPDEIHLAQKYFTFLRDSQARIEIVQADGRIGLQNDLDKKFDVLIIDAFCSETIPTHLATREAINIYLQRLQKDGLLLFHISNRFLDLTPVMSGHATAFGLTARYVDSPEEPNAGRLAAKWAILTLNQTFLENPEIKSRTSAFTGPAVTWTDTFASIMPIIK